MLALSSAFVAAAGADRIVERSFVWVTGRNRTSGASVTKGFHSDLAPPKTATVIDALDGSAYLRSFRGGSLVSIGGLDLISDLSVREATIVFAATRPDVDELVRTLDVRNAPVQIYWGLFDQTTRALVDKAVPVFLGTVDGVEITTAAEGGDSTATLTCVSAMRGLTRASTEVRSDASQRKRNASDALYKYVGQDFRPQWGPRAHKAGKRKQR